MVFHVPFPLDAEAPRASAIRPVRLRQAFADLGYEVHTVAGTSGQRAQGFRRIRRLMAAGLRPEFVYSETSTMPTALTDPHHLPVRPLQDHRFLWRMHRAGVPVGVFYRDIHWRDPVYRENVAAPLALATRALYRLDLLAYRLAATRLYLPSAEMAPRVPIVPAERMTALPPGCLIPAEVPIPAAGPSPAAVQDRRDVAGEGPLRLLYVGGLGLIYQLHELIRGVTRTPGARLTICTRPAEWRERRSEYDQLLADRRVEGRVEVVHLDGLALAGAYAAADLAALFVAPVDYWSFAAPVKLYEALGHGVPVLATEGTLSGRFVADEGVGWTLPYSSDALAGLLRRLREERDDLRRVAERVRVVRHEHTWTARARQVADDLSGAARAAGPRSGADDPGEAR